jgi:aminocarboxymuconate-semialdehyde decarboxylase
MSTGTVDVHAHHVGADAIERIRDEGADHSVRLVTHEAATRVEVAGRLSGQPLFSRLGDVRARLSWMDAEGIDVQLVSSWMDLSGYDLDGPSGRWLAGIQNDSVAALAAAHPDRFRAAAAVPLQRPDLAVRELRRAVTDLGHEAVQIGARVNDLGLDDDSLEVFWDAVEGFDIPVIVHPAGLDVPERVRRLFLYNLVGNPSETTFAAAALMLGGVLERHPRLRVLLVHGGGFIPYQIGRLDRGFVAAPPAVRPSGTRGPRQVLDQLYFDSVLHDAGALRHLVNFAGAGHVLLGSDYPFAMGLDHPVEALDAAEPDRSERETILRGAGPFGGVSLANRSTRSVPPRRVPGERWTA